MCACCCVSVAVCVHAHTHTLHGVIGYGGGVHSLKQNGCKSTLHNAVPFQNSDPSSPCTKHLYINLNYANANPWDIDARRQGG